MVFAVSFALIIINYKYPINYSESSFGLRIRIGTPAPYAYYQNVMHYCSAYSLFTWSKQKWLFLEGRLFSSQSELFEYF